MKVKEKENCEVPIAAMIDVVFLLLVYFVVTSTEVVDEAYVQVNTPGPVIPPVPEDVPPTLDIYVLDEHYEVMGRKYDLTEMNRYLGNISQIMDDPSVNIKVSQKTKHEKLVRLLDSLNKAKLSKFSLHTLK